MRTKAILSTKNFVTIRYTAKLSVACLTQNASVKKCEERTDGL